MTSFTITPSIQLYANIPENITKKKIEFTQAVQKFDKLISCLSLIVCTYDSPGFQKIYEIYLQRGTESFMI